MKTYFSNMCKYPQIKSIGKAFKWQKFIQMNMVCFEQSSVCRSTLMNLKKPFLLTNCLIISGRQHLLSFDNNMHNLFLKKKQTCFHRRPEEMYPDLDDYQHISEPLCCVG